MLQLLDDERMSHIVGSFSAVCSPPISMMYKGRKRSSSKLRTMEIMGDGGASSNALDEDIWAGLLKISKSSEELWKDVYSVFSPPTPIGSKVPEPSPFDSYKPGQSLAPRGLSSAQPDHSSEVDSTSADVVGKVTASSASSANSTNSVVPFVQTVPEKTVPVAGATVTNSIAIAQVPQSSIKSQPATTDNNMDNRRPKRNNREQSIFHQISISGKRPSSKLTLINNLLNPSNIHSIIHEKNAYNADREDGHTPRTPNHPPIQHTPIQHPPPPQLQRHNSSDLHEHNHHHMSNLNSMNLNITNMQMHNPGNTSISSNPSHSYPHHNSLDAMDNGHRGHPVYENRTITGLNHSINTTHHSQPIYVHSPAPMYNIDSPLLPCTDSGHSDPRNCNTSHSTPSHAYANHPPVNGYPSNNNNNNNTSSNSNSNSSGPNNDKWTEVILHCSKLVTLASSGLANNLTFAQLADGVSLARQITTATAAAVLNSSSYPPFQSTSVSEELNRLVMENLGPVGGQNPQSPNVQISPHTESNPHTPRNPFPFFSTPPINSLPSPSMSYSNSAPPSSFPSPVSYSTPPYSTSPVAMTNSSTLNNTLPLSSWPNEGAFANFVELSRNRLPAPSPSRSESGDESSSQPSSPRSPPAGSLSVVPLSPSLSPGGSSATVPPVPPFDSSSSREGKGKDEKGTWKKPRGKKRQKYEADLECRSCGARQTPEWRRGPFGAKTLCNACGLHWAKVLKAEGKGDQKRVALLEAKRSQFMMTQKRGKPDLSS